MPVVGSVRGFGWGREPVLRPNIGFTISPSYNGKTYWNFYDDGDFELIPNPDNLKSYTITFTANITVGIIGIGAGGGTNFAVNPDALGAAGGIFAGSFSANTTTSFKIFAGTAGAASGDLTTGAGGGAGTGLLTNSGTPLAVAGGGGGAGGNQETHPGTQGAYGNTSPGLSYVYQGLLTGNIGGNSSNGVSSSIPGGQTGLPGNAFTGGWGGVVPTPNQYHSGGTGGGGGGWQGGVSLPTVTHTVAGGANGSSGTVISSIDIYDQDRLWLRPTVLPMSIVGQRQGYLPQVPDSSNRTIVNGATGTSGKLVLFWKKFNESKIDATGGDEVRDFILEAQNGNVLVKEHVFKTSGIFAINSAAANATIEYMIVGGGGGGGYVTATNQYHAGGGGGGRIQYGVLPAQAGEYRIVVGAGGLGYRVILGTGYNSSGGSSSSISLPDGTTYSVAGGARGLNNITSTQTDTNQGSGQKYHTVCGLFTDNKTIYGGSGALSPDITGFVSYTPETKAIVVGIPQPGNPSGGIGNTRVDGQTQDPITIHGKPNTGGGGAGGGAWFTTYNRYINIPGNGADGIVILRYVVEQAGDDPTAQLMPLNMVSGLNYRTYKFYYYDRLSSINFYDTVSEERMDLSTRVFADPAVPTITTKVIMGYFKPQVSGIHTFYLTSDDASHMWFGSLVPCNDFSALESITPFIDNGDTHGTREYNNSIDLVAGQYYPFVVIHGNNNGSGTFDFKFSAPGTGLTTSFNGYGFINADTGAL